MSESRRLSSSFKNFFFLQNIIYGEKDSTEQKRYERKLRIHCKKLY